MISLFFKFISSRIHRDSTDSTKLAAKNNHLQFGNSDDLAIHDMSGIVTNICSVESYGLINNGIYFDFDVVFSSSKLKTGDPVIVSAERKNKFCGFIASSVILDNDGNWESECAERDRNSAMASPVLRENYSLDDLKCFEGFVTEFHGQFGILDRKYKFFMADSEVDDQINFKPSIGDIIVGCLVPFKTEEKVIQWKPKTVKKIEGTVTSREIDWGIINGDIVFFMNSCYCDFNVVSGQKIWVNIVESKNPPFFEWRAFSFMPYKNQTNSSLKPSIRESDELYIEGPSDFGNIILNESKNIELCLNNNGEMNLNLTDIYFQKPLDQGPFVVDHVSARCLEPGSKSTIKISCKAAFIGQDNDILVLEFDDFILHREITVGVIDPAQNILNPTAPFTRKRRFNSNVSNNEGTNTCIIPGQKLFNPRANFDGHLPNYNIPNKLLDAVLVDNEQLIFQVAPSLLEDLNVNNYYSKLSCLLHLEEIQMHWNMDNYEMFEKVLRRRGEFLALEVPGLTEGRPSLLIGDKAMLWSPSCESNITYEGYIHEVHQNDIFLKFHPDFQSSYNEEIFNVKFEFNRSNLRRLHHCIRHVYNSSRFLLFPKFIKSQSPLIKVYYDENRLNSVRSKQILWKNPNLNSQQKLAVQRILESSSRPLPYIIFGPPGTGKTITLVESILQIYETFENARILICTPTNSAADLITQRLLDSKLVRSQELVRLNSYQRNVDSIPDFIKPYCQDKDNICNVIQFPIIISTCSTAGILYTTKMASNHFTHVIVDEACQLTEPEMMIPVGIISTHGNGSLIMAGDHKQLGPVLQSTLAKTYGLSISYVERIMEQPLYAYNAKGFENYQGYNPQLVTMLIHCYRMHPAILWCPSTLFYNSQLICSVPEIRHSVLSNLGILPRKGFPLIFHGVKGLEEREEDSPSWFNAAEVVEVTNYLRRLYLDGLTLNDVGIITPYRKQVEKLRLFINAFSLQPCKIGSVEEFQGQERRAIIISTVRSNSNYINNDIIHNLGFLSNPKRFNVAISRAMELLIVVGNPSVLSEDEHWKYFIQYCRMNGGYTGWIP